ncbi:monocarboxylate transporter 10-like [Saccostrea echinata]|uniref:monocarboxylate transporter 10-like n=1 Tax=Saccostrea echinata TaxID=191078 RepID=UPI002A7EE66E|nr:monocarboxylate transporter 10-like [Saccostrea echinata]
MSNDEEKGELTETDKKCTSKFLKEKDHIIDPNSNEFVPPDGGWGWVVCFTVFLTNGTFCGILNTFGIEYVYLIEQYAKGDPAISFKTSWVGSVCMGVTFIMCIFAGICNDRIGIRPTACFGAILGAAGLFSSAFITQLELLYLTYGVLLGIGGGFIFSTSLVILGHYFKRHIGLANGIVAFGSSSYTIALSVVLPIVLESFGIKYTFLILGGLYCMLIFGSLTWKPLIHRDKGINEQLLSSDKSVMTREGCCSRTNEYLNLKIFNNQAYRIWFLGFVTALFGYFVPFTHLVKHTQDIFPRENAFILITCIQVTSGVGRLVFGKIADLECVNRVYMQQCAFVAMGIVTACIPFSDSFEGLIAICLVLGLTDGIVIFLIGPIAFDIVGRKDASQAIGFLLGGFSVPFSVGPPIAGFIYDHLNTYEIAFVAAGLPPILGAIIMCFIPRLQKNKKVSTDQDLEGETVLMLDDYPLQKSGSELPSPTEHEEKSPLNLQNEIKNREKCTRNCTDNEDNTLEKDSKSLLD